MEDVRYSELVFLQSLAKGSSPLEFFRNQPDQAEIVGLSPIMYEDMITTLLEELCIRFHEDEKQVLVSRLRGEMSPDYRPPSSMKPYEWQNPRKTLHDMLSYGAGHKFVVTYRGLRRMEELREALRRDRILEEQGVLFDFRYVHTDLQRALLRSAELPVSVLYLDLDKFKPVNDGYGHDAGDVVLKSYLEVVRDTLGSFGTAYRGRGDEVVAIVLGQGHDRAVLLAEKIRTTVGSMKCEFNGKQLPRVTASIGVATTPPEARTVDIESLAESRNRQAKAAGRDRVISAADENRRSAKLKRP